MDFHDFDPWRSVFEKLAGEQRESFLEFSFAVIMAKHAFYEKRKEDLIKAEQSSNVEKAFECRISIGVVEDILLSLIHIYTRCNRMCRVQIPYNFILVVSPQQISAGSDNSMKGL